MSEISNLFANPFLSFESIEISDYIIDELLDQGAKKLYLKYLKDKMADHNGQYMININRGVLQLEMLSKDEGENQFTYINKWNEEEEPIAPKIDSWGTLTVRREVKPQANISLYGGKTEDDAKSSKSFSTIKSYTLRSVKSKISTAMKMKNAITETNEKKKKTIIEVPKVEKVPDENPIKKDDNYYKDERLRTEREVKAREKNDEIAKKAKKQQEEDEAKERIKILTNKLKNKEYTYDYDGSIIFVRQNFRPDLLPSEIPTLDHNYKAPPEVVKQPYESLGIKIKETEETVARPSFTKEEILRQMQKAKESKKQNVKKKIVTKNKQKNKQNFDDEDQIPEGGIELPRQIPLTEIMEARTGVNIVFDNGFLKEGRAFVKDGHMNKVEFEKILEERKKMLEEQRKINRLDEKSQSDNEKNNEFKKQVEKIKELKSTTEKNLQLMNNLGLKKKQVLIHEEGEYVKMMATNLLGPQVDVKELEQRIVTKSMISQPEKPKKTGEKVKLERVTLYKKVGDLTFGEKQRPLTGKSTKLHQIVEEFNENEIINNPRWGVAPFVEEPLREKALPVSKKTGSPFNEKARGIKLRERGKLTSGNFFPKIASPSPNLNSIKANKNKP